MGLDQNLYLCKKKSKNGVKEDNEALDKYFRKNHCLHYAITEICNEKKSTNVEYIWISKEQWKQIRKAMKATKKNIEKMLEQTEKDLEWVKYDLKCFGEAATEIEKNEFFETGELCYYSWW